MAPINYNTPLMQKAEEIAQEFEYDIKQVKAAVKEYQKLMSAFVLPYPSAVFFLPV